MNYHCFSYYSPKLSLQVPKEYYKRLIWNNDVGFLTMVRVISYGLKKKVASVLVSKLQEFQRLELRHSTKKGRVYSDNYPSFRDNSRDKVVEDLHQRRVALTDFNY